MDRYQGQLERTVEAAPAPWPEEVLDLARVRRAELGLTYAGAVTPPEAWQLVQKQAAILIDVRTAPEFKFVGHVPGTANVEWHGKDEAPLAQFLEELRRHATTDATVLLICRSGVRSHVAAAVAAAAGFGHVYNVLEGFEGQIDATRQRGKINGWRRAGLPWVQD
jgi:rhodanese-related sulfurtransferase